MQQISVKSVKDGMILAEPLKNAHGGIVLGKGTVLTEAFASRLARMGFFSVYVEGDQVAAKENSSDVQTDDIQKIPLEKLFEGKIESEFMQEIYKALLRHRESSGG
jgi:isocitrate lyase